MAGRLGVLLTANEPVYVCRPGENITAEFVGSRVEVRKPLSSDWRQFGLVFAFSLVCGCIAFICHLMVELEGKIYRVILHRKVRRPV